MLNLRWILSGMLAFALLGFPAALPTAAAQAGTKTYEVTITNITNSQQGLSPLVLATHPASVHAWQMGQPASKGTEMLAEEGMPDLLAGELKGSATHVVTTKAHLLPGDSITVHITAHDGDVLSAASMLIQTNDGFTGLDSVALGERDYDTMAYDAGTEDNSEKASDVPGPPFGGKNAGPDSNPHQPISMHPGISGTADVTPDFKWSGPVAHFSIRAVAATPAMPGMPITGSADSNLGLLAVLAAGLVLIGLLLRRSLAIRRR